MIDLTNEEKQFLRSMIRFDAMKFRLESEIDEQGMIDIKTLDEFRILRFYFFEQNKENNNSFAKTYMNMIDDDVARITEGFYYINLYEDTKLK